MKKTNDHAEPTKVKRQEKRKGHTIKTNSRFRPLFGGPKSGCISETLLYY